MESTGIALITRGRPEALFIDVNVQIHCVRWGRALVLGIEIEGLLHPSSKMLCGKIRGNNEKY